MKRFIYLIICCLSLGIVSTCYADEEVQLYTENAPPFDYLKNGKLIGITVDIVNELQKRVGQIGQIEVVPWAHGYEEALQNPNVGLFPTTRTAQRENLFQWIGVVTTTDWVFFKKKGSTIKISSMEDARKVRAIGAYLSDAKEQFLKEEKFTNIDSLPNNLLNLRKLLNNRIDLWVSDYDEGASIADGANISPDALEVAYKIKAVDLYLVLSNKTSVEVVNKWKKAYQDIKEDGTLDAIREKYAVKKE